MLFSSLQETSVHTMWSPGEASLDRRAARRRARRIMALASGLERVAADARQSAVWGVPSTTLIDRPVATAVAATLAELAARLRAGVVDATSIDQIDSFLTDGAKSPLYSGNVAASRIEALRLLDLSAT